MKDSIRNWLFPGGDKAHKTTTFDEAALGDPRQRALHAYWKACGRDGRLPGRQDLDPVDFPNPAGTLPWVCLVEVHQRDDGAHFRYRLIGTGIIAKVRRDSTGKWFEEIYEGKRLIETQGDYGDVAERRGPALQRRRVPVAGREFLFSERLALPLAADGETVDMILAMLIYESQEEE